jgi:acyl-CoA synthetase (AMP-forming)/AMP-acid ligase II/alkylation response protein AidB-like acyl-CoA dehydrogenase
MRYRSSSTLPELSALHAREDGARLAYTFLADGLVETDRLTFAELDASARTIAGHLLERVPPGDCVLLMYDAGLDFVRAFFGCLYAGVVAVPLPALEAGRMRSGGHRLDAVASDCNARLLLGSRRSLSLLRTAPETPTGIAEINCIDTGTWTTGAAAAFHAPGMDALAYLQYTSGSTSTPRGVMIRHANLAQHLAGIQTALEYGPDSVSVCWMPHFHDYGLVEGVLAPVFNGTASYLMSPYTFLKRPATWLEAIGKYHGTHTQAFNYAYRYCARRIPPAQREGLDLSSLRSAGNGGEPIHPDTIEEFFAAFASCGLRRETMNPVFGLAEATLLVTAARDPERPRASRFDSAALARGCVKPAGETAGSRALISCGRPLPETEILIVDPDTRRPVSQDETGEIWVASPGVAAGYLGRVDESEATFRARVDGETDGRTWLRTGDIGFMHDGQLHISSRLKDLVIVHGLNYYPQDIEWTAQSAHPLLRADNGAAFGIEADGEERLCIVQEIERPPDSVEALEAIIAGIREAVINEHGVVPYAVTLIHAGSIPKTTSGKIQRSACRKAFLEGSLKIVAGGPGGPAGNESSAKRADELIAWLRDYAERHINSRLIDERRCLPPNIVLDLGNRGVFGLTAPEKYGGLNLSHSDALRVYLQLASIDPTIATLVFLHTTNGTRPILHFAPPELRDELMPLLAGGRELAAFTLSEPGAGTNLGAVETRIEPHGDGAWRIYGTKRWNGSAWTGVISVFGRLMDAAGRRRGMAGFVVRQNDPGVKIGRESLTMGVRGIMQNEVQFDGVRVTTSRMLGEAGKGMVVINDVLSHGRLATAAVALGATMRCAQLILRYASRREIETGILLENPCAASRISEMLHRIAIERETLGYCAARLDAGDPIIPEIAMAAKVSATETGNFSADLLVQLLGGRGYMENNLAPQIFRDVRMLSIGEGANEALLAAIGRSVRMTDTVLDFLRRYRRDGHAADRLQQFSNALETGQVGQYWDNAAEAWRDVLRGRLAVAALNVAAAGDAVEALNWAQQRFQAIAAEAMYAGPPYALKAGRIREEVGGLSRWIGDIEPMAPDVDTGLDPLLRRESTPACEGANDKNERLRELLMARAARFGGHHDTTESAGAGTRKIRADGLDRLLDQSRIENRTRPDRTGSDLRQVRHGFGPRDDAGRGSGGVD